MAEQEALAARCAMDRDIGNATLFVTLPQKLAFLR
ncbi:hypothetical protein CCP3SC15_1550008 [Gammaproteobacteria bacterium]